MVEQLRVRRLHPGQGLITRLQAAFVLPAVEIVVAALQHADTSLRQLLEHLRVLVAVLIARQRATTDTASRAAIAGPAVLVPHPPLARANARRFDYVVHPSIRQDDRVGPAATAF